MLHLVKRLSSHDSINFSVDFSVFDARLKLEKMESWIWAIAPLFSLSFTADGSKALLNRCMISGSPRLLVLVHLVAVRVFLKKSGSLAIENLLIEAKGKDEQNKTD